jgi:hypothetical protein
MELKIVALFLIVLIGGIGGGYGLSYFTYQPQIQNLQNSNSNFQNRVSALEQEQNELQNSNTNLQNRVSALEQKQRGIKTIRFYTPNETMNDESTWKDAATFVWTPDNSTNNAILSISYQFQHNGSGSGDCNMVINGQEAFKGSVGATKYYEWSQWTCYNNEANSTLEWKPNQSSYTIKFQIWWYPSDGAIYVKDFSILLEVIDGLPPT